MNTSTSLFLSSRNDHLRTPKPLTTNPDMIPFIFTLLIVRSCTKLFLFLARQAEAPVAMQMRSLSVSNLQSLVEPGVMRLYYNARRWLFSSWERGIAGVTGECRDNEPATEPIMKLGPDRSRTKHVAKCMTTRQDRGKRQSASFVDAGEH